jgi:hypothetical protein
MKKILNSVGQRYHVKSSNGKWSNGKSSNGKSSKIANVATRRTAARLMNWVVERQLVSWTGRRKIELTTPNLT